MKSGPKKQPPKIVCPVPGLPQAPPKHMCSAAKDHWKKTTALLLQAGTLSLLDSDALACYCETYARWVEATLAIREEGAVVVGNNGYRVKSPWLTIANECVKDLRTYQKLFGIVPSTRLKTDQADDVPEAWREFAS